VYVGAVHEIVTFEFSLDVTLTFVTGLGVDEY
jgi:hypothetical protein